MKRTTDHYLIRQIATRAAELYDRIGVKVQPVYIASELQFVHDEVCPLRLKDLLETDNSNFTHDIGGIHRHLNMALVQFDDCFSPRFAVR